MIALAVRIGRLQQERTNGLSIAQEWENSSRLDGH